MRAFALFVAAVALLAGCAAPADEPAANGSAAPRVVTSPGDLAALNASDEGWHVHDYWNDEPVVTVVDETFETGGWSCSGCKAIPLRFRGSTGMIVPMGTARIDVVAEWVASGETLHGPPELHVKTARDAEPSFVAKLEPGKAVSLNVTNEQADPPHQVLSRWEYYVYLPAVDSKARFAGTVRVFAEAHRGLPIPPLPPHPDLWQGKTEIHLFNEDQLLVTQHEDTQEGSRNCYSGCLLTHRPGNRLTVPHDAGEVVVTLSYTGGMPAGLGLRYHGGDTWERKAVQGQPALPNRVVYRIPVTDLTGDSPYATQSLWEFEVFADQPLHVRGFVGGYMLGAVAKKAGA